MATQIATSSTADATATSSAPLVAVAPSDAAINLLYFDDANGGPHLATAVSPYTTWATQAVGSATHRNSQALINSGSGDSLDMWVTSPANGPAYFTAARSVNTWSPSFSAFVDGSGFEATTTGVGASGWIGIDPQGRVWALGIDDVNATYQVWCDYLSGGTWASGGAAIEGLNLGETNHRGVAAAIIGNYLVVVYDSGAGGLKYLRRDVSGVSLGAWSTAAAVGSVADVGTSTVLSLVAIPGGSTGMLLYSGSNGISALTYTSGTDTWGSASVLSASTSDRHPVLIPGASGVVYAVWCQFAAANSYALVGKAYSAGAWSGSVSTLEASGNNIAWPTGGYLSSGTKLALAWTQGTANPWSVQFDAVAAPPTTTSVAISDTAVGRDRPGGVVVGIATTPSTAGYLLFPSNSNQVAYLPDGSLLFVANQGTNLTLYRIAAPDSINPTATSVQTFTVAGLTAASLMEGDIFVQANNDGSADVWVAYGEQNNVGGAGIQHATYSKAGVWSWDTATSLMFQGTAAGYDQANVIWTGTYLIVSRRMDVSGVVGFYINYTTDKTGQTGWLASALLLSSIQGTNSHYFGQLMHSATLGCTVAVYTIAGDAIKSRVLPDASSPALANWGPETDLGVGTNGSYDNFQGPSVALDHSTGRVHVAYASSAGTPYCPGYVSGTVTVNGASSAVSWGTPLSVGTQTQGFNASPSLCVDGQGTVWVWWNNHYPNNTASDVFYATVPYPYTAVNQQVQYTTTTDRVQPQVPKRDRVTRGYIPLFYWSGTVAPYNIDYDSTVLTPMALADLGVGSESISVSQGSTPVSISDSASGLDTPTLVVSFTVSDSASGGEGVVVAPVSFTVVDAASGVDTPGLAVAIPLSDAAVATDVATVTVALAPSDAAVGSEATPGLSVAISLSDAATGAELQTVTVTLTLADLAVGSESVSVNTGGAFNPQVTDTGGGAEALFLLSLSAFKGAKIVATVAPRPGEIAATNAPRAVVIVLTSQE